MFYDNSQMTVYSNNVNSTVWIPITYTIQSLDNRTNALLFQLPPSSTISIISNITTITYNRLLLPFPLTYQSLASHFFILIENIRNPYSLAPFMLTYLSQQNIQSLNNYLYSSGTSNILKNTLLMNLTVANFNFTSRLYNAQSNLNFNISLSNWN